MCIIILNHTLNSFYQWTDRAIPADRLMEVVSNTYGISGAPMTTQIFGNAGREHMEKYGKAKTFAEDSLIFLGDRELRIAYIFRISKLKAPSFLSESQKGSKDENLN